jgi:hypothetical protein
MTQIVENNDADQVTFKLKIPRTGTKQATSVCLYFLSWKKKVKWLSHSGT